MYDLIVVGGGPAGGTLKAGKDGPDPDLLIRKNFRKPALDGIHFRKRRQ